MKKIIVMSLLLVCTFVNGQIIFSHEKKIEGKENYTHLDIDFFNYTDNILLSGTLLTPKSSYKKIVVIVPGSGKDTRYSHYKLASTFLENNIAVYRFDERGVGKSQGNFTSNIERLTDDVSYCIKYLKSLPELKNKEIGILGHSLGGMASAITSNNSANSTTKVDFLIQIASPVKNFSEASKYQIQTLPQYKIKNKTAQETIALLDTLVQITKQQKNISSIALRDLGIKAIHKKGFKLNDIKFWSLTHINLFKQDYETVYKQLQIPTIYLIGTEDKFVNPKTEVNLLKNYNNPLITVKVMKNLNHYLTAGALQSNVIYNIDKKATDTIINWIQKI
ncbi:alpha/beta hydrolase [Polaribacter gochangensis]|uniref:alpha/beta hydrolase n=1 Tax=Polaribacter gochangensis TaxID=3252903 RepID=UPI003904BF57